MSKLRPWWLLLTVGCAPVVWDRTTVDCEGVRSIHVLTTDLYPILGADQCEVVARSPASQGPYDLVLWPSPDTRPNVTFDGSALEVNDSGAYGDLDLLLPEREAHQLERVSTAEGVPFALDDGLTSYRVQGGAISFSDGVVTEVSAPTANAEVTFADDRASGQFSFVGPVSIGEDGRPISWTFNDDWTALSGPTVDWRSGSSAISVPGSQVALDWTDPARLFLERGESCLGQTVRLTNLSGLDALEVQVQADLLGVTASSLHADVGYDQDNCAVSVTNSHFDEVPILRANHVRLTNTTVTGDITVEARRAGDYILLSGNTFGGHAVIDADPPNGQAGQVNLEGNVFGPQVTIRAQAADMEISHASNFGTMEVTNSTDIYLTLSKDLEFDLLSITTDTGLISLYLPPGRYDIDVTWDGTEFPSLPTQVVDDEGSARKIVLISGNAQPSINLLRASLPRRLIRP